FDQGCLNAERRERAAPLHAVNARLARNSLEQAIHERHGILPFAGSPTRQRGARGRLIFNCNGTDFGFPSGFSASGPEYTLEETRQWIAALSPNRRDLDHDVVGKSIFVGVSRRIGPSGMSIRHKDLRVVEWGTPIQNSLIGQGFQKFDDRVDLKGV